MVRNKVAMVNPSITHEQLQSQVVAYSYNILYYNYLKIGVKNKNLKQKSA